MAKQVDETKNEFKKLSFINRPVTPERGCSPGGQFKPCPYLAVCRVNLRKNLPMLCEGVYPGEYVRISREDRRINIYPSISLNAVVVR